MRNERPPHERQHRHRPLLLTAGLMGSLLLVTRTPAQFEDWKHSGSIYILTTREGANLPAPSSVTNFPVLVRLHRDHFRFSEAASDGRDVRFSAQGRAIPFEIDSWDSDAGEASVWVRVPTIRGDARQEIRIHWGNLDVKSASNAMGVFNPSNGFVGVWHLGHEVRDVVGRLESEDRGTSKTTGRIGGARRFPGKAGIFCGKDIQVLPAGGSPHTTQAWFRPESAGGRVVCWGNEKRAGKVTMVYQSPPRVRMDCYFSSGDVRGQIPGRSRGWTHAVHTFENRRAVLYINGEKQGEGDPRAFPMALERPARLWIGGWYDNYDFVGEIDEVRISSVARSAEWVRLEYENQKPNQTLVGHVVQAGDALSVTPSRVVIDEGDTITLTANAGGAQKVYWSVVRAEQEAVVASDRFRFSFEAGRVSGDRELKIRFDAIYADTTRSIEVPVTIRETLPEPRFALVAPKGWDGRETIEVRPEIANLEELRRAGVGELDHRWTVSGLATLHDEQRGQLVLERAQNSGSLTVTLALSNGGDVVKASTDILVEEPESDTWVARTPDRSELPVDGQFYARDDSGQGTLYCRGVLPEATRGKTERVFLRVFADGKRHAEKSAAAAPDGSYSLAAKLDAALVRYSVELGMRAGGVESILHRAGDIVCGDAYLIDGQSNALATDTREDSPRVTSDWIRSYGIPRFYKEGERENLWCKPVWKAGREHLAELGWWGMELARQLVESQRVPIFIVNAARGGTRIDQHQRNDENPTDLDTIYGRMLWRLRKARLTHGIRAIIWHQGENDQGAAGPDGGYGWETYHRYFVEMSADWKRDLPNVSRYYVFQIWPSACAMGRDGNGDMLREKQRLLPSLYSNMEIISTLGIRPPGGCHYPLLGWTEFARRLQILIERDFYGRKVEETTAPANLEQAYYTSAARDEIALRFDQPVVWKDSLVRDFRLDGVAGQIASGVVSGNVLRLELSEPVHAERITYLDESSWSQDRLLLGKNGVAALTFCNVTIARNLHDNTSGAED